MVPADRANSSVVVRSRRVRRGLDQGRPHSPFRENRPGDRALFHGHGFAAHKQRRGADGAIPPHSCQRVPAPRGRQPSPTRPRRSDPTVVGGPRHKAVENSWAIAAEVFLGVPDPQWMHGDSSFGSMTQIGGELRSTIPLGLACVRAVSIRGRPPARHRRVAVCGAWMGGAAERIDAQERVRAGPTAKPGQADPSCSWSVHQAQG